MNALTIHGGNAVTMTSLEMVEFINNQRAEGAAELRHDHFMAKVPKVLSDQAPKFLGTSHYVNGAGNKVPRQIYIFPKREACLMAMSYSYDLQAKVFDKMTELEAQVAKPAQPLIAIPQTLHEALRLAADLAEQKENAERQAILLEHKVEELEPKAAALDLISAGSESLTFTQVSKVLGIKLKELTTYMHAQGWIYRQNGSWVTYHQYIKNGYLQYKEAKYTDENTGQKCIVPYCHILPKGLAKLAERFGDKEAA